MKRYFLTFLAAVFCVVINAQKEPGSSMATASAGNGQAVNPTEQPVVRIYPVPVKENNFFVSSEKEISMIRVTNIIGQEILSTKYPVPVLSTQVILANSQRGMYLVTIIFSDNTRTVRKIMVEALQ